MYQKNYHICNWNRLQFEIYYFIENYFFKIYNFFGGEMKLTKLVTALGISSVILFSSISFTGCTPKITDEQLARLQELRKQEKQINADISSKQSEISKVEGEIKARQAELNNCNKDLDFVKQKLSQWPNVWPDYTPSK